jgi:hypothetical protein
VRGEINIARSAAMKHILASVAIAAIMVLPSARYVIAGDGNPSGTGQPTVECSEDDIADRPGNAGGAPGSAFNPDGMAGTVYAGEQDVNNNNPNSVSQYDVACIKAPQ